MKPIFIFLLVLYCVVLVLMLANLLVSSYLDYKHKLFEDFEIEAKRLNDTLDSKMRKQESTLSMLQSALSNFVHEDIPKVTSGVINLIKKNSITKTYIEDVNRKLQSKPCKLEVINKEDKQTIKTIDLSKLSKEDKSLGDSLYLLKKNNKEKQLTNAMRKINMNVKDDLKTNFCNYRATVGLCKIGGNECRDFCPQDFRGKIWG